MKELWPSVDLRKGDGLIFDSGTGRGKGTEEQEEEQETE